MQKEKLDGTTTIEASWKIHSHRTFIFFCFLKVCRFCLYKDRPGSWPAVWHNEKRLRFVSNADISSCTVPPPRRFHRLRLQHHISISFFPHFFLIHRFPVFPLISSLRAEWNIRSRNPMESFFLSSLLFLSFSLSPSVSPFLSPRIK